MASTIASIEIPAPADRVWQLIGGFDALPDWLPFIPSSESSEGGRVRTLTSEGGDVIVERLLTFDEEARTYSYSILKAPFPAADYVATLKVHEMPGQDASRVEWSGVFTPVGAGDDEVVALFHGIFSDGLAALKQSLAA
ncbi:SRPBCC family protein [Streptomyces sp. NBC_01381]|uniref:SRPBCC family protein n=1 Tax=Streptomyces sp. NBC_01381 TaxID=2903845 RepID=UPI00224D8B5E|nr:SRPBCC family protein [Streptomyces sp. NBC_01381]MCX4672044.1 SRPBCC family protein [Streptomyces sp. NBC_01381]